MVPKKWKTMEKVKNYLSLTEAWLEEPTCIENCNALRERMELETIEETIFFFIEPMLMKASEIGFKEKDWQTPIMKFINQMKACDLFREFKEILEEINNSSILKTIANGIWRIRKPAQSAFSFEQFSQAFLDEEPILDPHVDSNPQEIEREEKQSAWEMLAE